MTRVPVAVLACLLACASARGAEWKEQPLPVNSRPGDQLGSAVAVGKDFIAVGAYLSDAGGKDSGSVYLFKKMPDGTWVLFDQFHGAPGEWFGFDVAINETGTLLAIGAPGPGRAGAVYTIDLTAVRTPRVLLQGAQKGDELGSSVAIDGNRVAAGARGADRRAGRAYMVEPSGATRTFVSPNSKPGREFGQSISLSGNRLVVGEPLPGEDRRSPGAAYLFDRSGANPVELKPSGLAAGSAFGYSVVVRGHKVVAGAPLANSQAGEVYSFDCESGCAQERLPFDARPGDQVGVAVAMSRSTIVAGGRGVGDNAGVAYLYTSGSYFALPHSPLPGSEFGFAAAVYEDVIAVGAFKQGGGAAYVFEPETAEPQTITLSLDPVALRVGETAQAVVNVMLSTSDGKPTAKSFTVTASAQDGTALASAPARDYRATSVTRNLRQGTEPGRLFGVRIPIVADAVLEPDETFQVVLTSLTQGVAVQGPATVTIVDNDCVQLSLAPVSVAEGVPLTTYRIHLPQPSASAVTLTFTSASPDVSVTPVTFSPGDQDEAVTVSGDDSVCNAEDPTYTITVTADSADPDFACIQEELTVTLAGEDDRNVEVHPRVCTNGGAIFYTWEIKNVCGPLLAGVSGPEISESLPDGVTVVHASAYRGVAHVDHVENEITWNGSVPAGSSAIIEILATLEPGVDPETDLGFEATYRYAGGETAFEVPFVVGEADICEPPPPE